MSGKQGTTEAGLSNLTCLAPSRIPTRPLTEPSQGGKDWNVPHYAHCGQRPARVRPHVWTRPSRFSSRRRFWTWVPVRLGKLLLSLGEIGWLVDDKIREMVEIVISRRQRWNPELIHRGHNQRVIREKTLRGPDRMGLAQP